MARLTDLKQTFEGTFNPGQRRTLEELAATLGGYTAMPTQASLPIIQAEVEKGELLAWLPLAKYYENKNEFSLAAEAYINLIFYINQANKQDYFAVAHNAINALIALVQTNAQARTTFIDLWLSPAFVQERERVKQQIWEQQRSESSQAGLLSANIDVSADDPLSSIITDAVMQFRTNREALATLDLQKLLPTVVEEQGKDDSVALYNLYAHLCLVEHGTAYEEKVKTTLKNTQSQITTPQCASDIRSLNSALVVQGAGEGLLTAKGMCWAPLALRAGHSCQPNAAAWAEQLYTNIDTALQANELNLFRASQYLSLASYFIKVAREKNSTASNQHEKVIKCYAAGIRAGHDRGLYLLAQYLQDHYKAADFILIYRTYLALVDDQRFIKPGVAAELKKMLHEVIETNLQHVQTMLYNWLLLPSSMVGKSQEMQAEIQKNITVSQQNSAHDDATARRIENNDFSEYFIAFESEFLPTREYTLDRLFEIALRGHPQIIYEWYLQVAEQMRKCGGQADEQIKSQLGQAADYVSNGDESKPGAGVIVMLVAVLKDTAENENAEDSLFRGPLTEDITDEQGFIAFAKGMAYQLSNNAQTRAQGTAKSHFIKSSTQGFGPASRIVGNIYFEEKNYQQSEHYYLIAIEQGDLFAWKELAYLYLAQAKFENALKAMLFFLSNANRVNLEHHIVNIRDAMDIVMSLILEKNQLISVAINFWLGENNNEDIFEAKQQYLQTMGDLLPANLLVTVEHDDVRRITRSLDSFVAVRTEMDDIDINEILSCLQKAGASPENSDAILRHLYNLFTVMHMRDNASVDWDDDTDKGSDCEQIKEYYAVLPDDSNYKALVGALLDDIGENELGGATASWLLLEKHAQGALKDKTTINTLISELTTEPSATPVLNSYKALLFQYLAQSEDEIKEAKQIPDFVQKCYLRSIQYGGAACLNPLVNEEIDGLTQSHQVALLYYVYLINQYYFHEGEYARYYDLDDESVSATAEKLKLCLGAKPSFMRDILSSTLLVKQSMPAEKKKVLMYVADPVAEMPADVARKIDKKPGKKPKRFVPALVNTALQEKKPTKERLTLQERKQARRQRKEDERAKAKAAADIAAKEKLAGERDAEKKYVGNGKSRYHAKDSNNSYQHKRDSLYRSALAFWQQHGSEHANALSIINNMYAELQARANAPDTLQLRLEQVTRLWLAYDKVMKTGSFDEQAGSTITFIQFYLETLNKRDVLEDNNTLDKSVKENVAQVIDTLNQNAFIECFKVLCESVRPAVDIKDRVDAYKKVAMQAAALGEKRAEDRAKKQAQVTAQVQAEAQAEIAAKAKAEAEEKAKEKAKEKAEAEAIAKAEAVAKAKIQAQEEAAHAAKAKKAKSETLYKSARALPVNLQARLIPKVIYLNTLSRMHAQLSQPVLTSKDIFFCVTDAVTLLKISKVFGGESRQEVQNFIQAYLTHVKEKTNFTGANCAKAVLAKAEYVIASHHGTLAACLRALQTKYDEKHPHLPFLSVADIASTNKAPVCKG